MIYVSIDIETTGINEETCDILEFGAIIDNLKDIKPIATLPRFHCYFIKPEYNGSPTALAMHPIIFKRIANREKPYNYISADRFGNQFKNFLLDNKFEQDKGRVYINAAGKNFAYFDARFLEKKTDISKHVAFRHRILDPAPSFLNSNDTELPRTEECMKRMILKYKANHTAIEDAEDVIRMVRFQWQKLFSPSTFLNID